VSAVEALKDVFRTLVEADKDASVLIIEDDEGCATGFVYQTSLQKKIFELWGQNIVLDWTHNTNNIGYYLGKFSFFYRRLFFILQKFLVTMNR
jgi:hypothetical protein